jgi:hypothetical protein
MSADGPALLAAAVRAACQANAPRRTVQAVAAAVTGVLVRPHTVAAEPHTDTGVRAGAQSNAEADGDPAMLLSSLRAVRKAQRQRKKERRLAAKQAAPLASNDAPIEESAPNADVSISKADVADQSAVTEGVSAAVPAPQPGSQLPSPPTLQLESFAAKDATFDNESLFSYAPTLRSFNAPTLRSDRCSNTSKDSLLVPTTSAGGFGPYGNATASSRAFRSSRSRERGKSSVHDGKGKR